MPNRKHLHLLGILMARAGHYAGYGTDHDNKESKGDMELAPIVNRKMTLFTGKK